MRHPVMRHDDFGRREYPLIGPDGCGQCGAALFTEVFCNQCSVSYAIDFADSDPSAAICARCGQKMLTDKSEVSCRMQAQSTSVLSRIINGKSISKEVKSLIETVAQWAGVE